jgi:RimJ/RimL family protein N-acetyltransferase
MPGRSISALWETAVLTRVPAAGWIVALDDDELAARAPDRPMASASMIKTFLALAAARLCPDWSGRVAVEPEHRAAGDGMLRHLRLPVRLPLGDVVAFTIAMSDNTAANTVIAAAGGLDRVNDELARRGFDARMLRWLSDAGPAARAGTYATEVGIGVCSPREHTRAVAAIADAAAREPTSAYGDLHRALHAQQDRRALARWLVEDAPIAHKTGTVRRLRHDGGDLEREGRRLRFACFTDGGPAAEWIDHPACVAMAEAMAWTAVALGWEDYVLAEAASAPAVLVDSLSRLSPDDLRAVFCRPDIAASLRSPEGELAFWSAARAGGDDVWAKTVVHQGRPVGLVCLYGHSGDVVDVGVYVFADGARRRGVACEAVGFAARAARSRGAKALRWTASAGDHPSLALAAKLGFVPVERRVAARVREGAPVDEEVLELRISPDHDGA